MGYYVARLPEPFDLGSVYRGRSCNIIRSLAQGGGASEADLCDRLSVNLPTVRKTLRRMEEDGLVFSMRVSKDRRVFLTDRRHWCEMIAAMPPMGSPPTVSGEESVRRRERVSRPLHQRRPCIGIRRGLRSRHGRIKTVQVVPPRRGIHRLLPARPLGFRFRPSLGREPGLLPVLRAGLGTHPTPLSRVQ